MPRTSTRARTFPISYVKTIGLVTNQPVGRGFANPCALAVAGDGRIYVVNRGAAGLARVGIVNLDEDYLGEFGSYGDADGQFKLPSAIALDSKGNAYVADEYHHRISVFDASGKFLSKWGAHGQAKGQMDAPAGLALDARDNLYVSDQNNHRVQVFTTDGRFLSAFGAFGAGDGQLNQPWGITVGPDGNVYVADWRNDRIQKFSPDGAFLGKFGSSGEKDGQFNRPSAVAVDTGGNMYVADWMNHRVQALAPDGRHLVTLRGEATVSKWAEEFFAANPDEWGPRQESDLFPKLPPHLQTPYHISSQTEAYFWGPTAVALDADNRLYVAETNRHRIQVYKRG